MNATPTPDCGSRTPEQETGGTQATALAPRPPTAPRQEAAPPESEAVRDADLLEHPDPQIGRAHV